MARYLWILLVCAGIITAVAFGSSTPQLLRDKIKDVDSPLAETIFHALEHPRETLQNFISNLTLFYTVCWVLGIFISYKLLKVLFIPLNIVRRAEDMGYIMDGAKNKLEVVNDMRKRRKTGDTPPVYPNGWFSLGRSHELKNSQIWYVSALGLELAVYRDEDGDAHILDAYCPHMGSNIAVGGVVKGKCVACPFHGWNFDGKTGKVTKIPYAEKIPENAKIKSYICLELNGLIHLWFDAEGREPCWYPPAFEDIKSGRFKYHGQTDHLVNAHIEEIPENGADLNHLTYLHEPFLVTGRDLRYTAAWVWQWLTHLWDGVWDQDKDNSHIGIMTLTAKIGVFGKAFPYITVNARAEQVGPGLVYLHIFLPLFGEVMLIQTVTPVEPLLQKVQHTAFAAPTVPRVMAKFALWAESVQFERDLMVWNHKTYESKPLLVKEDRLVKKHRMWYSQFYSENSPRLRLKKNEGLDW